MAFRAKFDTLKDLPGFKATAPRPFWKAYNQNYALYLEEIMNWIQDIARTEENRPVFYIYFDCNPGKATASSRAVRYYNPTSGQFVNTGETVYKLPYSRYAGRILTSDSDSARVFHSDKKFFKEYFRQIASYIYLLSFPTWFSYAAFTNGIISTSYRTLMHEIFSNTPSSAQLAIFDALADFTFLYNKTGNSSLALQDYSPIAPIPPEEVKNTNNFVESSTDNDMAPDLVGFKAGRKVNSTTSNNEMSVFQSSVAAATWPFGFFSHLHSIGSNEGLSNLLMEIIRPKYTCIAKTKDKRVMFVDAMYAKALGTASKKSFIGKYTVLDVDGQVFDFDKCILAGHRFNYSPKLYAFWKGKNVLFTTESLIPIKKLTLTKDIGEIVGIGAASNDYATPVSTTPITSEAVVATMEFIDTNGRVWFYNEGSDTYSSNVLSESQWDENPNLVLHRERPSFAFTAGGAGFYVSGFGGAQYYSNGGLLANSEEASLVREKSNGDIVSARMIGGYPGNGVAYVYGGAFVLDNDGVLYGCDSVEVIQASVEYFYNGIKVSDQDPFQPFVAYPYIDGGDTFYVNLDAVTGNYNRLFKFEDEEFVSSDVHMSFALPPYEILPRIRNYFGTRGFISLYERCSLKHNAITYNTTGTIWGQSLARFLGNHQITFVGNPFTTQQAYKNFKENATPPKEIDETIEYPGVPPISFAIGIESKYYTKTDSEYSTRLQLANTHKAFDLVVSDNFQVYDFAPTHEDADSDGELLTQRKAKIKIKVWPRTLPLSRNQSGSDSQLLMFGNFALNFDRASLTTEQAGPYGSYWINPLPNSQFTLEQIFPTETYEGKLKLHANPWCPYREFSGLFFKITGTYDVKFSIDQRTSTDTIQVYVWDVTGLPSNNQVTVGQTYSLVLSEGLSSYPHEWFCSDPSVAQLNVNPNDTARATLTILTAGTFFVNVQDSAEIPWKSGTITATNPS